METIVKNPSWWRRRSILEICLPLICISVLIAITKPAGAIYIDDINRNAFAVMSNNNSGVKNKSDICDSVQCYNIASEVIGKMNPEIEPCDDFYQFACGGYYGEIVMPGYKVIGTAFHAIPYRVAEQLNRMITDDRPPTDPKHLRLPNIFYKACMNTTLIEELGATPIKEMSDAVGGWPLIKGEAWDPDDKWSWQETSKKLRKLGFPDEALFSTSIDAKLTNNTNRILMISPPDHVAFRLFLKNVDERIVHSYMVDIAVLFGADEEKAKIELREVMEFKNSLANIPMSFESRVLSIKQLQESYPYVRWLEYINVLLPEELVVDENEPIKLLGPSFFDGLGPLLAETPKRVIANYMIWQIYGYAVPFLSEKVRKRYVQYQILKNGIHEMKPRWKECVDLTKERLKISVESLYAREYFGEETRALTLEMVNKIRSAFRDMLNEVDWMDINTKQEAKKKLQAMIALVGAPDEFLDDSKLEEYHRKLEIDTDQFFKSILKLNSFDIENNFKRLRLPVNKTNWEHQYMPTSTDGLYFGTTNSITITLGLLQAVFNAQRPMYMNYGTLGFIIGHEITHGFDPEGQQYDKDGNLVDWWQPNTKQAFQDRATCIKEQYGNYTDRETGLRINGVVTLNDNIADNGGFHNAYMAYRKWAATNGPEPKLPGLDYTSEQMFWISSAQFWCKKHRNDHLNTYVTTDVHSPPELRMLGSFRNMKDFSKDFQCPVGSPMNPVHKCEVW